MALILDFAKATHTSVEVQREFGRTFQAAMMDIGFVRLVNHGIAPILVADVYAIAEELFQAPEEILRKYHDPWWGAQRGVSGGRFHPEVYDGTHTETKEMFTIGSLIGPHPLFKAYPDWGWVREWSEGQGEFSQPRHIRTYERVMELFNQLHGIFLVLISRLAEALNINLEDLVRKFKRFKTDSIMRFLQYRAGQGSAEHRDTGMLTLMPSPTRAGLEIKDRAGGWERFASEVGELIVNMAKLLAYIVNAILKTTVFEARDHRVVRDPDDQTTRHALPFFGWPDPHHPLPDGREAWMFLRDDLVQHRFWPPSATSL